MISNICKRLASLLVLLFLVGVTVGWTGQAIAGITLPAFSNALPATGGAKPTLTSAGTGVTLGGESAGALQLGRGIEAPVVVRRVVDGRHAEGEIGVLHPVLPRLQLVVAHGAVGVGVDQGPLAWRLRCVTHNRQAASGRQARA